MENKWKKLGIAHEKARSNKAPHVGKCFHMVFANGWEVSVSWFRQSCSKGKEHRFIKSDLGKDDILYSFADSAEVMIIPPEALRDEGSVRQYYDYQSPDQIAEHIARTQLKGNHEALLAYNNLKFPNGKSKTDN
jgi:hypothetical protein|tara:strand:+ start:820 stop:1221 length:402 start_codon:yes stop_codon:yes gene_type:complete